MACAPEPVATWVASFVALMVGKEHARPQPGKALDYCPADAARAAGYEHD